jgi:hypothetical protein
MKIIDIPFTKLSPGDISRPWLSVTIINPQIVENNFKLLETQSSRPSPNTTSRRLEIM